MPTPQQAPKALTLAQYPIAQKPAFGGEFKVYLSPTAALEVATFDILDTNSGLLTPDPINVPDATVGNDLLLIATTGVPNNGASNAVVVLNVTDTSDVARTVTGTLKPIVWSKNQSRAFQLGYAVDLVPSLDGAKVKTIVSLASITCGAVMANTSFKIFAMPLLSSYSLVGFTTDNDFTTKAPAAKPIPERMDGSAAVKAGRSPAGELNIKSKYVTLADGLARYDGLNTTARADLVKEGQVITDRLFFIGHVPKVKPSNPDGDGESMSDSAGFYATLAITIAPGVT